MSMPMNLDNIREMLGGDPARERELFDIYIQTSEECLDGLRNSLTSGNDEEWRTQAHALKGMSLNLGAETLGQLCAEAQKNSQAPKEDKEKTLDANQEEYARVKAYLQEQSKS